MPAAATAGGLPSRLGKYEILSPLATGGMARIYIARTTGIGSFERHVVLKLITPERANDHTAVQMFLDEARLAASLNHQNVAQVFEVGEDNGIHYLAMEYVHGQDLRALLAKAGSQGTRVPLDLALTAVAGSCAGLNHAHERRGPDGVPLGIVHRDVSPSNLMIGYDGSVKLLDFGIAKATARSVETQSGIIKGKFAYMAPEQCRGRDVDRRSDVFSLGIILYEITTQHRCFRADSDFDTMHRIVTGDVVRPTRLIQGYPPALEAIVMKALAVDANQRYQSAALLLEAIEQFAASARMSLSTMALGRFMREMFGDQPEPWQTGHARVSAPLPPRESTISSTNAGEPRQPGRASTANPNPRHDAHDAHDDGDAGEPLHAARTLLEVADHRAAAAAADDETRDVAGWAAKPPSYHSRPSAAHGGGHAEVRATNPHAQPLPPLPVPPLATASGSVAPMAPPGTLPVGSQPMPPLAAGAPAGAFHLGPGSGSGPSHASLHGYAPRTGSNDLAYPRYEAPASGEVPGEPSGEVRLRPSRRPLVIGGAVVLVGLTVLVAAMIGGSGDEIASSVPAVSPPLVALDAGTGANGSAGSLLAAVDAGEVAPSDEMISIKIASDPAGAEVLLFGKSIGTTPLDTTIKRGTGSAYLTVHRAKYEDVTTRIDLNGDFETTVALRKLADPEVVPAGSGSGSAEPTVVAAEPTPDAEPEAGPDPGTETGPSPAELRRETQRKEAAARRAEEQKRLEQKRVDDQKRADQKRADDQKRRADEQARRATEERKPKKQRCQPDQGRLNPFDTSCDGKACPPCDAVAPALRDPIR